MLVPKAKTEFFKILTSTICNTKMVTLGHELTFRYYFHTEITAPRTYLPILFDYKKNHTEFGLQKRPI